MHKKLIVVLIGLILFLVGGTAGAQEKQDTDAKATTKAKVGGTIKANKSLCKRVAAMIKNKTINRYVPERIDIPIEIDPRGSEYRNLDIDGDGKPDKVTVSSGSDESLLEVKLSTGSNYEINDGLMKLIKLNGRTYALVTYWETSITDWRLIGHRLYWLTKQGADLVCDTDNF